MQDLRSYSTNSHATTSSNNNNDYTEVKMKRSNSKVISSSSLKNWSFNDPEMQRKKRVVGYKAYGVEGKMKAEGFSETVVSTSTSPRDRIEVYVHSMFSNLINGIILDMFVVGW
ncbi:hypothetical protein H5410_033302 [Solanum commersonii]|uniref:Uncharacterized protein n=1 Tax=Solanum commersonii TaxID=4109 RepID=A0A9J5YS58_SOLCO|nr:hypothetical protein H5410_033302 [Solanum commersonii]